MNSQRIKHNAMADVQKLRFSSKRFVFWYGVAFSKAGSRNNIQRLVGHQFHNDEDVGMCVAEWLLMQEHDFYCDGMFKLVPSWTYALFCTGIEWHK